MVQLIAVGVFVNVRVVEKYFVVLDASEGIADLPFAGAKGFHLRSAQHDSRLEGLEDVVIAAGFRIAENVRQGTGLGRSMFSALFGGGPNQFRDLGHFETNLFLDDFAQRDIRRPHITGFDQGTAQRPGPGIELADPA